MQNILLLMEKVLDELCSMWYYNSIVELIGWFVGFLVFLSFPSGMALIWLHMLHVPRGIFGLFIWVTKFPQASTIISKISEFDDNEMQEQWKFEKIAFHIRDNFKEYVIKEARHTQKYLFVYFIISAIWASIDFIGLFIQIILFGTSDNVYEPLFMMALVSIFVVTNLSYFLYLGTFTYRIPPKFRSDVYKAILGRGTALIERIMQGKQNNPQKRFEEAKQ